MSRGDEAKAQVGPKATRARGAAIAAACLVFVLAAAFFTLWATHGIERLLDGGGLFGVWSAPLEPFAGARSAVAPVGWHGCLAAEAGPTVGAPMTIDRARVDAALTARGYLGEGEWSEPRALPIDASVEGLDGACGLYAVVIEEGNLSTGNVGSAPLHTACDSHLLLLGACGGEAAHVMGVGTARVRTFAAPGLTPDTLRAIGVPIDVALAHADAASALSLAGWTASDELIGIRVPAGPTTYGLTVRPPRPPTSGCTAYVAVGVGLGHARMYWPGTSLREESTVDRFVTTPVACGGSPSYFDGTFAVDDADHDGGRVWFRAYTPARGGPSVPAPAARRPLEFTMRLVRGADAVMPTPVPALAAP